MKSLLTLLAVLILGAGCAGFEEAVLVPVVTTAPTGEIETNYMVNPTVQDLVAVGGTIAPPPYGTAGASAIAGLLAAYAIYRTKKQQATP